MYGIGGADIYMYVRSMCAHVCSIHVSEFPVIVFYECFSARRVLFSVPLCMLLFCIQSHTNSLQVSNERQGMLRRGPPRSVPSVSYTSVMTSPQTLSITLAVKPA